MPGGKRTWGRPLDVVPEPAAAPRCTIRRLCQLFQQHADAYYRTPDGRPATEIANFKPTIALFVDTFGDDEPDTFTPSNLKLLRTA